MSEQNHEQFKSIDVILEKISNLEQKIVDGFNGVHSRQDKTNGKIAKHSDDINDLKIEDANIAGKLKNERVIWMLLVALVGVIGSVAGNLIFN